MLLQSFHIRPRVHALPQHLEPGVCVPAVQIIGRTAYRHARKQKFPQARRFFEHLLNTTPQLERAWISYAQMEKRCKKKVGDYEQAYHDCKKVLERGLTHNPHSSRIIQALGLLELQYDLHKGAVEYLEIAAELDPACAQVLRWKRVQRAKAECCQHCMDLEAAADTDLLAEDVSGFLDPRPTARHSSD